MSNLIPELLNSTETRFLGDNVLILNPDNLGQFNSAAAAIAAVPEAGTIELINDYDCNIHGGITITKPVTIRGFGIGKGISGGYDVGTRIINLTSPIADVITITGGAGGIHNVNIKDLHIKHTGSGYAINMTDVAFSIIENVFINCNGGGYGGIIQQKNLDACFYVEVRNSRIKDFTGYGIRQIDPRGTKNIVEDCHIQSTAAAPVCAIWWEARDGHIIGGQINAENAPSIIINVPSTYNIDIRGVIVENVVSEADQPIVTLQSSNSGYVCRECIIRNCKHSPTHANRAIVILDEAENCIVDLPLKYGVGTNIGNIFETTANAKNNTVILDGDWTTVPFEDLGENTVIKMVATNDKELLNTTEIWPTTTKCILDSSSYHGYPMLRSSTTTLDGITGVWNIVGSSYTTPGDIPSCVLWMDASNSGSMFNDVSGTTQASDGEGVLVWKDSLNGSLHSFDTIVPLTSISSYGNPTGIDANTLPHGFQAGDSVTISGVTINSGPNINGTHTVGVTDFNTFTIPVDSTGASYTITAASQARNLTNTPQLETDVNGKGVPGIYFDGVKEYFNGPVQALGGTTGTLLAVCTLVETSPTGERLLLGRNWATTVLKIRGQASQTRLSSTFNGTNLNGNYSNDINTPDDTVVGISTANASNIVIYPYMSTDLIATGASSGLSFTDDALRWQIGASGKTNNSGSNQLFYGYIHAIAMFTEVLTQDQIDKLGFYFTNKFKGKVVD